MHHDGVLLIVGGTFFKAREVRLLDCPFQDVFVMLCNRFAQEGRMVFDATHSHEWTFEEESIAVTHQLLNGEDALADLRFEEKDHFLEPFCVC